MPTEGDEENIEEPFKQRKSDIKKKDAQEFKVLAGNFHNPDRKFTDLYPEIVSRIIRKRPSRG